MYNNIEGYGKLVSVVYALCRESGERYGKLISLISMLYALFRERVERYGKLISLISVLYALFRERVERKREGGKWRKGREKDR